MNVSVLIQMEAGPGASHRATRAAHIPAIDWDSIELLPRHRCCVCGRHAVPWGRTVDDEFLCSHDCDRLLHERRIDMIDLQVSQ